MTINKRSTDSKTMKHIENLELALTAIKAIQDLNFTYDLGSLPVNISMALGLTALNEMFPSDPIHHVEKNTARSQNGLIFNIELAQRNTVHFIGEVIHEDRNRFPTHKMFDYAVFVTLTDQMLAYEVLMIKWEKLVRHLDWGKKKGTWKLRITKKLRKKMTPIFPIKGHYSSLTTKAYYHQEQGLFLPAF